MKVTSFLVLIGITGLAAALPQAEQPARPSGIPSGSGIPPRPSRSNRPIPSGLPSEFPSGVPLPSGRPSGPRPSVRPSRTRSAGVRPTPSGAPAGNDDQ